MTGKGNRISGAEEVSEVFPEPRFELGLEKELDFEPEGKGLFRGWQQVIMTMLALRTQMQGAPQPLGHTKIPPPLASRHCLC